VAALAAAVLVAVPAAGCGSGGDRVADRPITGSGPPPRDPTAVPLRVGPDSRWRPPPLSSRARAARPIAGLPCSGAVRPRFGVHVELFARRRVMIVAPGIGVAPPHGRQGAYVPRGRCSYPLRTREPTGVIEVERGRTFTLGDLFAIWGQPLSARRLGAFRGPVVAYVAGMRRPGDPRAIPLRPHAQIVLETGGHVPPHRSYRFPTGL
jgi:hypothetical protein